VKINLDSLREHSKRLHSVLRSLYGFDLGQVEVELNDLDMSRLNEFNRAALDEWVKTLPPPKPVELPPQIDFSEVEAEQKRDIQARAD
jgi:hypothetical protein